MAGAAVGERQLAEPPHAHTPQSLFGRARAHPGLLLTLAVFAVVRVCFWATGGRFSDIQLSVAWQLLDIRQLAAHPFHSVFYLHTQPPLFNLLAGIVLRWSPLTTAVTFQLFYLACGVIIVVALRALLIELGFTPAAATAGACVVAANPVLLTFENAATYEYPVAMLIVVSAWLLARCVTLRRTSTFAWFVIALTAIVLTRALLHPVWLIAAVLLALAGMRPRLSPGILAVLAIPLVVIGGWMLKNQLVFHDATLSSWFGMNLDRGVTGPMPISDTRQLIREGKLSKAALIPPLSYYSAYAPDFPPCKPKHPTEAVLTAPYKTDNIANFNDECFLPVYSDAQKNAIAAVRARPLIYLERRWYPLVAHFIHAYAPAPTYDTSHNTTARSLLHVYNAFPLTVPIHVNDRGWTYPLLGKGGPYTLYPSLVLVLATLLICGYGVRSARRLLRGDRDAADVTWVYIAFTVLYVTLVSVATEYGENGRFRVLVDPLLFGVVGAVVATLIVRVVQRPSHGEPPAAETAPAGDSVREP